MIEFKVKITFGYSRAETFDRFEGGRLVTYAYRIDYDSKGVEKSRTKPEAISSIGWGNGEPYTPKDHQTIMNRVNKPTY